MTGSDGKYVLNTLVDSTCPITQHQPLSYCTHIHSHSHLSGRSVVERTWLLKPVESGGCGHGVRPHVLKVQPVTNVHLWEEPVFRDHVQSITGWSPYATPVDVLLFWDHQLRLWGSVVVHYTVEGPVESIVHIIPEYLQNVKLHIKTVSGMGMCGVVWVCVVSGTAHINS